MLGLLQVEGGFVQGMGWTCLEELVWGDEDHKWLPPGVLHTRGPGLLFSLLHMQFGMPNTGMLSRLQICLGGTLGS